MADFGKHPPADRRPSDATSTTASATDADDGAGDASSHATKRSSSSISPEPRGPGSSHGASSSSGGQTKWRRGQKKTDGSLSLRRREQNRLAQSRFRAKRRAESIAFHGLSAAPGPPYPQWLGRHASMASSSATGIMAPSTPYPAGPSAMPCHQDQGAPPQAPGDGLAVVPPPPWISLSQGVVPRDPTPFWPPIDPYGLGSSGSTSSAAMTGLPRPVRADPTTTTTSLSTPVFHPHYSPHELPPPTIPHATPSYPMTAPGFGHHHAAGPAQSAHLPHGAAPPLPHVSDVFGPTSLASGLPRPPALAHSSGSHLPPLSSSHTATAALPTDPASPAAVIAPVPTVPVPHPTTPSWPPHAWTSEQRPASSRYTPAAPCDAPASEPGPGPGPGPAERHTAGGHHPRHGGAAASSASPPWPGPSHSAHNWG